MKVDEQYMRRALQLAALAEGHTSPNPMVGAVVVHQGRIIGEGYHRRCGEPHAEVNAIASVRDKSLLPQSTIYVTLEPCSHYGKTPPCCDLIIASHIPRVVVGCLDPFPQVSGRGVARLREHNIEVCTGILEEECLWLNRRFITFHSQQRPYITLKWAQSADGYIDRIRSNDEQPTLFSTPTTRSWAHRLRATNDAILVGTNTVLADNPSLTTRYWTGHNPVRITIDCNKRIPACATLLDGSTPTLLLGRTDIEQPVECIPLEGHDLSEVMQHLYRHNIQSLIVEGGSHMLQSFINASLWDEAHIERTPLHLVEGIPAPTLQGTLLRTYHHNKQHTTRIIINR